MSKKPQTATDGISNNPERAIKAVTVYTDWEALKRAYLLNETHPMIGTWLQQVMGWDEKKIKSGHTRQKIDGWGKEWTKIQQRKTEVAIKKALEIERRTVPKLRAAKASLIANIIRDVKRWDRLNVMDKKLCYEILKVELREPTNVKDLPPAGSRDPVEALLEEFGLMKEGEIIIDDEPATDRLIVSGADSKEAPATDSDTPVEISQA